jgi:ribonuclease VapC
MVLDSSALVAIMLREFNHAELLAKIKAAPGIAVGGPTLLETLIVLMARLGRDPIVALENLLHEFEAEVIPFTDDHVRIALNAYVRYGKGRHPAALNFGDCLCYATASLASQPLLYVGNDFSETDIQQA